MLQRVRQLKKEAAGAKAAGFTIIEVMIVLAIAGLIMAIVFLAIPALQKNNRNTQRKNDASRVSSLINDFVANNNGKLPSKLVFTGTTASGELDLTKERFSIIDTSANVSPLKCTDAICGAIGATQLLPSATNPAPATDFVKFVTKADCGSGGNNPEQTASARSYAIWYGIEGSTTTQCIAS